MNMFSQVHGGRKDLGLVDAFRYIIKIFFLLLWLLLLLIFLFLVLLALPQVHAKGRWSEGAVEGERCQCDQDRPGVRSQVLGL